MRPHGAGAEIVLVEKRLEPVEDDERRQWQVARRVRGLDDSLLEPGHRSYPDGQPAMVKPPSTTTV
jgi:hypothetical protein